MKSLPLSLRSGPASELHVRSDSSMNGITAYAPLSTLLFEYQGFACSRYFTKRTLISNGDRLGEGIGIEDTDKLSAFNLTSLIQELVHAKSPTLFRESGAQSIRNEIPGFIHFAAIDQS